MRDGEPHDNEEIASLLDERLDKQKPWVLLGGPPCQAYSGMGRSRMKNADPEKFAKDHRHTLYQEYLRVVARWRPAVFVMENVKGVLSSEHGKEQSTDGAIVNQILADLERPVTALSRIDPAYAKLCADESYDLYSFVSPSGLINIEPSDLTIHAEEYGIPQARHRVIILGVRRTEKSRDWIWRPIGDERFTNFGKIDASSAICDLPTLHGGITSRQPIPEWSGANSLPDWKRAVEGYIRPLLANNSLLNGSLSPEIAQVLRKNLALLRRFQPDDRENYRKEWGTHQSHWQRRPEISDWYRFEECYLNGPLDYPLNHYCKDHQASDLARYFFVSSSAGLRENKKFKLRDFPQALLPKFEKLEKNKDSFTDCFTAVNPTEPSLTVMSHISKDGHYYIHYDPKQVRSLSVREAARLQTFPDDYFFEGPKTEQYHQVGNAVPPMLATQLAEVVYEIIAKHFKV
ncbi:DNA cytosine methyltransferase [Congregibacter variabilis]|uniref:DNA (cytosine-5-)-methyltransferase n=1 Tax=Congregibacter variabilis TaxID=3081200 RepID=A0ABZ0I704_9GAMM|nr:DNA cytosine methyltransferase [Congregibacter sp. IMCC43200]